MLVRRLRQSGIGALIAGAIVAANFAFALQLTGLSYDRFQWTAFGVSYQDTPTATPTATPTSTPTSTPTNTPVPNGGSCMDPAQCASTFCVTGVCCDRACDQPNERCNLAGSQGICTVPSAPAPALSGTWLVAGILVLLAIGGLSVRSRRARHGNRA